MPLTHRGSIRFAVALCIALISWSCDKQPPAKSPEKESVTPTPGATKDDAPLRTPDPAQESPDSGSGSIAETSAAVSPTGGVPTIDLADFPANIRARIENLQASCREAPSNTKRLETLAAAYSSINASGAAAACFDRAAEIIPGNFRFHYLGGLLHLKSGNAAAARRAFERASGIDPNYAPVHVNLGLLAIDEDTTAAMKQFETASELDATDEIAWWGLGRCAQKQKKPAEAIDFFRRALDIMPNYRDAIVASAECYQAIGNEEAAKLMRDRLNTSVLASIDNDPVLLAFSRQSMTDEQIVDVAMNYANSGYRRRAIQILGGMTMLGRDSFAIRRALGILFVGQDEQFLAADEFNRALEFQPDSADVHSWIASAYMATGQTELARTHVERAQALSPEDPTVLSVIASVKVTQNDLPEAERIFQKAIARAPNDAVVLYRAAKASIAAKDWDTARQRLVKCLDISPDYSAARFSLGLLELQSGKRDEAEEHWQRIVDASAAFPDAYLTYAALLSQTGNDIKALEILRRGFATSPSAAPLANAMAWIFATTPRPELRNPKEAVRFAEFACRKTNRSDHEYLDTLAAAQAAAGYYEMAVATINDAIRIAESENAPPEKTEKYRQRYSLYRADKAFYRSAE